MTKIDPEAVAQRARRMADARPPQLPQPIPMAVELDIDDEVAEARDAVSAERWSTLIPSRWQWARPDLLDDFSEAPQIRPADAERLREWACSPRGRNLVVLGPVGTGKTHAAVAAVWPLHEAGWEVRFFGVEELLDLLRPGGPDGAIRTLGEIDVLVIDDVGAERPTDWTAERFYAVVNRRWSWERPTVFTSNLTPKELGPHVGQRAYSRMTGGAVVVTMAGPDRRKTGVV